MNRSAGKVDWTALMALAATIAALAAVASSVIVVRGVREDAARTRFNAGLESLWHLTEEWNSEEMTDTRSHAAASLLAAKPTADVNAVLDFFDEVALLLQRGALDEEMVWHEFYWPIANYWFASQEYIQQVQHDDPTVWTDLNATVQRLVGIEARRKRQSTGMAVPSLKEMRDFLTDETGADECTDDEEVRKTPL